MTRAVDHHGWSIRVTYCRRRRRYWGSVTHAVSGYGWTMIGEYRTRAHCLKHARRLADWYADTGR